MRLASYGSGMKTSGRIEITKDIELPIEGKDVLIVEDIIDSGHTLQFLKDRFILSNPRSVKICALLDKKARREVEIEADYLGIDVDDVFIVGYGIDFNEHYRNLPEIYYVTPIESFKGIRGWKILLFPFFCSSLSKPRLRPILLLNRMMPLSFAKARFSSQKGIPKEPSGVSRG